MTTDRGEFQNAGEWLQLVYQSELLRPDGLWIDGHPDWEGIAAWLFDVYLNARERGLSPDAARGEVLRQIRSSLEWRQKHETSGNPNPPATGDGTESGRLRVAGLVFRRDDGSIFQWRGCSDFLAFSRFRAGEDLTGLLNERIGIGFNTLRVFGMVDWEGWEFGPGGDRYYEDLSAFADLLASRGVRVEFTAFADAGPYTRGTDEHKVARPGLMPDAGDRRRHIDRVANILVSKWNATLEVANEPFKNLPGGDDEAMALGRSVQDRGLLVASGAVGDAFPPPVLDYGTHHAERKPEWPRTAKDILDLRDVTHVPWVSDEPMGAAEQDTSSRSTNAEDFGYFGATAALMGAGATFHSTAGLTSVPFGPLQRAAAIAFAQAMRWVPPEAQTWPYQRGDPGSEAGIGNMPILHDDTRELRSFCKGDGDREWCIQIRTTREHATPRDHWHVVEEPRRGFVRLE